MDTSTPFKWRHFEAEIILLCVRWYLRYSLSYRDLEEMMRERGLSVDHSTIYRWVQCYAPEIDKRSRPHLKACNDSWKVDETSIKIRKTWMYLYRAVDSDGNTLEFLLSPTRDAEAAKRFAPQSAGFHGWFSSSSPSGREAGSRVHGCGQPRHHEVRSSRDQCG
jgi:transposase-like protein